MSQRFLPCGLVMVGALGLMALVDVPLAWAQKPKDPKWTHAFDLSVRKLGQKDFDPKMKFGTEVFKDLNTGFGVYITEKGYLAVTTGFEGITGAIPKSKGAKQTSGLDLPARAPGQKDFGPDTKTYPMEVYHDPNVGAWVYITDDAKIAVTRGAGPKPGAAGDLRPNLIHSVDLRCRKGGNPEWTKDTPAYGVEIYRDENNGNLVYISNAGYIAIIPDNGKNIKDKTPAWLHGLDLKCRRANEPDFTKDTKIWGVEVFRDETNGNLIYITETGGVAVAPGKDGLTAPTKDVKTPTWKHGLNLSARKFGEKEFTDQTKKWGGEVFLDENTGVWLYIGEAGAISVLRAP